MPRVSAFDANGTPRSGAKLYFYTPSTTTPKDVYSDSGLTTPITQPVTASSAGLWATIFCQASLYRVILKDSAGTTIWDEDNYDPSLAAGFGVSSVVGVAQGGTGASNAASARANLEAASTSAVTAVQDTVTEHETFIDTARNVGTPTRAGLLAAEDEVTRALMASGTGAFRLQRVSSTTISDSTVNTTTPAFDSSAPQVGEGEQIMSLAITPLLSTTLVQVRVYLTFTNGTTPMDVVFGLFRNGAASAVAAEGGNQTATQGQAMIFYSESPGSTSTITYTIRAGVSTSSITIPGTNSLGSLRKCLIEAEEWVSV